MNPYNAAYPRDLIGYAGKPPQANWPHGAKIAVQFVLNYEEGGENCVLHGDAGSEQFLSDIIGAASYPARHMSMESMYEYGSRAGVWRILKTFAKYDYPITVFGVGMALERNPLATEAFLKAGHELACHGYRWIHYQDMDAEEERALMTHCVDVFTKILGHHPEGWYTGRDSPNTHRLVADEGKFLYDADYYGDDLPFYLPVEKTDGSVKGQLIVPYTLEANDMRFANGQGFITAEHFYQYLKDTFDVLYAEGEAGEPKMMNVGIHCRISGRPGRIRALQRFLEYISQKEDVWVARRVDIAKHWLREHPLKED